MGMDVYGKNAASKTGEYFRRSVWGWRPLADYIQDQAPEEITSGCKYWNSNDCDGLDAVAARALAAWLDEQVASGEAAAYCEGRDKVISQLPRRKCECCNGTGIRSDHIGHESGWPEKIVEGSPDNPRLGQKGSCNACGGWGSQPAWDTNYPLEPQDMTDFAAFCRDSGGFEIC